MLKPYSKIILATLVMLSYEYAALNQLMSWPSFIIFLKKNVPAFHGIDPSPKAGHPISYWLGWIGMTFMLAMLSYSARKRLRVLSKLYQLPQWLNFHIFCGLIGPIFIFFHCNFKVRGLVAVSFWSMCVSASSGIIGRYFYLQVLQSRKKLLDKVKFYDEGFAKLQTVQQLDSEIISGLKRKAIQTACGVENPSKNELGFMPILFNSLRGDLLFLIKPPKLFSNLHPSLQRRLKEYGKIQRQIYFMDTYKKFMGYWHIFHIPFAIFMYLVAIIHITSALMFKVN
ncbi:MAG: hypothetical protein R3B45_13470 [Bdellovibrionota bacterium]